MRPDIIWWSNESRELHSSEENCGCSSAPYELRTLEFANKPSIRSWWRQGVRKNTTQNISLLRGVLGSC